MASNYKPVVKDYFTAHLSTADWVEANLVLPGESSSRRGPVKLDKWQRGVLDAFDDPRNRQITLMIASQIGKTFLSMAILCKIAHQNPENMIIAKPRAADVKGLIRVDLEPAIDASPVLRPVFKRTHKGEIPLQDIRFNGGAVSIVNSQAPASYRGKRARLVIADEIDMFEETYEDADDPLDMLVHRGTTYPNFQLIAISTPTRSDGRINKNFLAGDQREFFMPCPACGVFSYISLPNIDKDAKRIRCPGHDCGYLWSEAERRVALEQGEWRPTSADTATPGHVSFHLNQFASSFKSVEETLREYDATKLKGFYTQKLAEPFDDAELAVLEPKIISRAARAEPPWKGRSRLTTMSVDVQKDRFEWQIQQVAPSELDRFHVPAAGIIQTREYGDEHWFKLEEIARKWKARVLFIDASFKPDWVLRGVSEPLRTLGNKVDVLAVKGFQGDSFDKPVIGAKQSKGRIQSLHTSEAKEIIYDLLRRGLITYNPEAVPSYFAEQMASERCVSQPKRGNRPAKRFWEKLGPNEQWDLLVYGYCAIIYERDKPKDVMAKFMAHKLTEGINDDGN